MVYDLYRKFAPEKLCSFDALIEKYKDKLEPFYHALLDKYVGRPRGTTPNASLQRGQCRVCLKFGHWGNECPEAPKIPPAEADPQKRHEAERPEWRQLLRWQHNFDDPDPDKAPQGARGSCVLPTATASHT